MKKKVKKIIGILLSLALVLSLMPCMSLTALAWDGNPYASLVNTTIPVKFNGIDWYIIEDNSTAVNAGTVTLLAAESFGSSKFDDSSNSYDSSTVKEYLDNIIEGNAGPGNPDFSAVANAIEPVTLYDSTTEVAETTGDAKLYLMSKDEAENVPKNVRKFSSYWWLRSPGEYSYTAAIVRSYDGVINYSGYGVSSDDYGVRPALKLNLSAVIFDSDTQTFTVKPYVSLKNTTTPVNFDNKDWYLIDFDATTVTLLAKNPIGASKFDESSNEYKDSDVKEYLEGQTNAGGSFADVANAIVGTDLTDVGVTGAKLWLLSISEAEVLSQDVKKCNQATEAEFNFWWLRSPRSQNGENAAWVYGETGEVAAYGYAVSTAGGVRPALKLDLEKVVFDSGSKTFSLKTSLGTGEMAPPSVPAIDKPWTGSYVYYGKYDGTNPTKYRVLDKASNDFGVTGGSLLLDCDSVLYEAKFDETSNDWANSDVKAGLNGASFLTKEGSFTPVEINAIASSTKENAVMNDGGGDSSLAWAGLSNNKVFLLDAREVTRTTYGYSNTNNVAKNMIKTGIGNKYCLRSPSDIYDHTPGDSVGFVSSIMGGLYSHTVDSPTGVSPAFNVSLSSIIFSSLISGVSGSAGAEYKLTLKDPNLTIAAGAESMGNNKYRISYDITDNSTVSTPTQVSVVVTDKPWTENGWTEGANLLQYSKLEMNTFSLSDTGTFTLDGSITGTLGEDYFLYVLAEDKNGEKETDFASKPLEIKVIPSYLYSLNYDPGDGGTGSMASEKVSTKYDFTFPACGFTGIEGKSFDHWKMSGADGIYYPNGTVIIADICAQNGVVTVTAHWKSQPAAKVTTLPTAKTLTYTGSPQALVNSGVAEGGTMKYVLGENATTAPTSGWDTGIPEGTEAKTYYVWYKVFGDDTHSDTTPVPLTVTIKKKSSGSGSSPGPSYSYYTVKFEMNGHGEQVSSQTVRSGLKAKEPSAPTAEEYYFAGWFEDEELTKEYDFSSPVRKSMTLYARWEEIRYTVSFDLDGKGSIEIQWVRKNGMAEKPDDPSAEGFTFGGWYLDSDCKTPYDFSTPVTKDITLYAKWVKDVLIYRLYNPNSGGHLFTSNGAEKDNLVLIGWEYEGVAWTAPASSNTPVYRVYNPNSGEHHYTMNAAEKDILVALGWNDEGICWYSDEKQGTPLYRLYNPNAVGQYAAGAHHYTKDMGERDILIAAGWNDEGIGWYGL